MNTFLQELKKRRVYRVAIGYGVAASALVQVGGSVLATFHTPEWVQQVMVALLALGFPVALMLAWVFDMRDGMIQSPSTLHGLRNAARNRRVWILGAVGLLLASTAFVGYEFWHPWASSSSSRSGEDSAASDLKAIPEKSIAVLPFVNLSDDKQNVFFIEGVQDEILNDLAKVADLKVISRTSVMQYKGNSPRNLREIGKALGVAHVVEGSVQRSGTRVRVTVQLIDARTDIHLWGDRYDRDVADVFDLESELAERIVSQLKTKLSRAEKAAIEERPTTNLAAYDLYIRAKILLSTIGFNARVSENLLEAARFLDQAVAADPSFFLAYYQLAGAHDQIYLYGVDHTPARLALAEAAVQAVERLRPGSGEAHLARARHLYWGHLQYEPARKELVAAQRMLPNDPNPFLLAGYIDRRLGKWEESTRNLERALNIDPGNPVILQQISQSYSKLRRFADVAATLDRAIRLAPGDIGTRVRRAEIELEWHADTKPLHSTIQGIIEKNPQAASVVADAWIHLTQCERDREGARRALAALPSDGCHEEGLPFPHAWCEGLNARLQGDAGAMQAAFKRARSEIDKLLQNDPDYGEALCVLGMIDAALGRKEEAIREGRRATELLPVAKDSINGAILVKYLAAIYAWTGDKDAAIEWLTVATRIPGDVNYGQLRLDPIWDPVRNDPRFREIVRSLTPK